MRVLMFDIDTLRSDHLDCCGYGRDTSPIITGKTWACLAFTANTPRRMSLPAIKWPGARESAVLTQCCHVCQRSARFGDYLYIRTIHGGYHLFP